MTVSLFTRRLLVAGCLAVTAACGDNPAAPGPVNVFGEWTGTWQFATAGLTVTDSVRVVFVPLPLNSWTGLWSADSGASGQFQIADQTSTTGTFTITLPKLTGGTPCTATATVSGTLSSTAITLSVPSLPSTNTCPWATDHQFSFHR